MPDTTSPTNGAPTMDQIITDPSALAQKVLEWKQKGYHVLSPAIRVWAFAPNHGVNISLVTLNPDNEDCYRDPSLMKSDERAISKIGLLKIAQAAGVNWVPNLTVRMDDRRTQHFWEFRAVGVTIGYDGMPQVLQGTVEIDLRDGSAQINGWSEARVLQARRFGLRLSESKAMEAAIRQLGLKSKYTVKELAQPFVILRVSYVPDLSDARIREMVALRALSGAGVLYAGQRALPEPMPVETIEVTATREAELVERQTPTIQAPAAKTSPAPTDTKPASNGTKPAASETKASETTTPATEPPGVLIVEVKVAKETKEWTLHTVVVSTGEEYTTFDDTLALYATKCKDEHIPVEVLTEKKGKYTNVIEIRRAGTQPRLPLAADELKL